MRAPCRKAAISKRKASNRTGEANPAVGTILFISYAWRSYRASGSQVHFNQCKSGAHVQFHWIRESQRTLLVWDQDRPRAAPGYLTTFFGLSLNSQSVGLITRKMLVQVGRFAAYAVRLRLESRAIAHGVQPDRPFRNSLVAQSAEHVPLKHRVGGANPPEAATFMPM